MEREVILRPSLYGDIFGIGHFLKRLDLPLPLAVGLSLRKWLALQDRVKSRRDPVFMEQKFRVLIPTLEVTHIVRKRIFKSFQTRKTRQHGFQ